MKMNGRNKHFETHFMKLSNQCLKPTILLKPL